MANKTLGTDVAMGYIDNGNASFSMGFADRDGGQWTVVHAPAAATQATITKAAGAAGVRHVATSVTATIACGATAQTPLSVTLRDGATGTGTPLAVWTVSAIANSCALLQLIDLNIIGSAATAMCLEFSGAGVAVSLQAVTLGGYDL